MSTPFEARAPSSTEVQVSLTERETAQMQRLLSDPTLFPLIFKTWVSAWAGQEASITQGQVQPPTGGTQAQSTRGVVGPTGSPAWGTGFSVSRTALGSYQVSFNSTFSAQPVVIVTAYTANDYAAVLYNVTTSGFQVKTWTLASAAVDAGFTFIAMDAGTS